MTSSARTIVITGGNSGIGLETARVLGREGWRVVITGRDEARLARAAARLERTSTGPVAWLVGDFASLASVRALAGRLAREARIDVLLNNAGIALSARRVSVDGNDMMVQVNHLAAFLLTNLLLDKLKAEAPARIVNIASNFHFRATGHGFNDFQMERGYSLREAYSRTKLYNVMFTRELARRLVGTGVTANALHPGVIRTRIGRDGDTGGLRGLLWPLAQRLVMGPPETGARVTHFVATAPELDGVTGEYFSTELTARTPNRLALDEEACRRLWEMSAALVGLA